MRLASKTYVTVNPNIPYLTLPYNSCEVMVLVEAYVRSHTIILIQNPKFMKLIRMSITHVKTVKPIEDRGVYSRTFYCTTVQKK